MGSPKGWNAESNESNGKTEVKAPAKTTQKRPCSINLQTTVRYFENKTIKNGIYHWDLGTKPNDYLKNVNKESILCGARFVILNSNNSNKGLLVKLLRQYRLHPSLDLGCTYLFFIFFII